MLQADGGLNHAIETADVHTDFDLFSHKFIYSLGYHRFKIKDRIMMFLIEGQHNVISYKSFCDCEY